MVHVDFTDLKEACPKDNFLFPWINQLMDALARHELLSFMDALSKYNQIRMHQTDEEKMAFIIHRGLYCYRVMLFVLKNADATHQRLVNMLFKDQLGKTMEVYIDGMIA